jgi:ABC-type dipeptide/oligopeptide/nickel transport system permease component
MVRFALSRLALAIPTIFFVTVAVFGMLYLTPGDPASIYLGDRQSTPERLEQIRHEMGLDRPIYVQYFDFAIKALRGEPGRSLQTNRPVIKEILDRLPNTLELTIAAFAVSVVLGVGFGLLSAVRYNTWIDTSTRIIALAGVSMPVFWLGALVILFFSLQLRLFPVTGNGGWERLVMPALVLGIVTSAPLMRLVRGSMLDVLRQEYVTTARAKGLRERVVLINHALRNALIPIVTVMGLQLGALLSGAVIIESVFARAGIGKLIVDSILSKDFPVVQATTLYVAIAYVLLNTLIDFSYAFLDPRVRVGASQQ